MKNLAKFGMMPGLIQYLILQTAYSARVMISGPNQFNKTVGQSTNIRCTLKFEEDEEFSEKPDLLWTDPKGNSVGKSYNLNSNADKKTVTFKLFLSKVQIEDSGNYTCTYLDQSKSVTVNVNQAIKFSDSQSDTQIVNLKDKKTLTCEATPDGLSYSWFYNGDRISTTSELQTADFTKDSSGVYTCRVDNSLGNAKNIEPNAAEEKDFQIEIQYPPVVTTDPADEAVVVEGNDVSVTCKSDASPPVPSAKITWKKDGEVVSDITDGVLSLSQVEYVDGGISYTCESTNDAGTGSANINIKVIQKPVIKIAEKNEGGGLDKNEGDQLTLTCDVTAGDPVPTNFTWTLPSGTTQDGANLVIGPTKAEHHGTFSCTAKSSYNGVEIPEATDSIAVNVRYAPKFVSPQDTEGNAKVFGVADKELKLDCSFKGNPAPNVTWEDALTSTGTPTTATADSKTTASITLASGFEFKSYTCTGTNGIGEDVSQVIEVVQASVPATPEAPTIKDKGHTDLTVTWTKPASDIDITSYTISYRDDSGTEKTTTSDAEEIKLGDLTPGKTYEIWVIAENDAGKSDPSGTVTETTKKPPAKAPTIKLTRNVTEGELWKIKWNVTFPGADNIESVIITYKEVNPDGSFGAEMVKEIQVSSDQMMNNDGGEYSLQLTPGKSYYAEVKVRNDQKLESDATSFNFDMPKDIQKGSTGTVIGVMVGIIVVLIIFVDISCYYMKQGGFIMTCQRALCANNDEKDDIEKDAGEKVPLNQESGSLDGKNDKNANSDKE